MAVDSVEASHINLFPGQLVQDREMLNLNLSNQVDASFSAYNPQQQMRFLNVPCATATSLPGNNQSFYQTVACETNTDCSGLTYNNNISTPRKRSRDQLYAVPNYPAPEKHNSISQLPTFAGEHVFPQIHQYQLQIDAIISQHTKKIRLELEEKQKHQARMLASALVARMLKKLKEKDEHIQRIEKLNLSLQERVKSLYVENQLWRDLAHSNEATANALRLNLEQVLLNVGEEAAEEDVASCCGGGENDHKDNGAGRACGMCGEKEACVLVLPCRHLCLCGVCGSGSQQVQVCPVCNSSMNATLHINMST